MLVLLTTVAPTTFHVIPTTTLSVRVVTLKRQRSNSVALTSFASFVRKSVLVWSARIATQSNYAGPAEALAAADIASAVERADWIAVTCLTSISALQVEESVLTTVAILAHNVRFAFALSANLVTLERAGRKLQSTTTETLTCPAIAFVEGQSVAKEAGQTRVATVTARVVNTLETFTRRAVTVAHGVRVDVSVTVARLTWSSWTETAFRVSEISIAT